MTPNDFETFTPAEKTIVALILGVILTVVMCGCEPTKRDKEVANSAATIHEAVQAVKEGVAPAQPLEAIDANAKAIEKSTGAVGVPAATAVKWHEDPPKAAEDAGAQAKKTADTAGWGIAVWSGILTAGLGVLAVAKRVVPLIPGVGPLWASAVDGLYALAQHKEAKELDNANVRVACAVSVGLPAIREFRELFPESWLKLPENVRVALENIQKTG